MGTAWSQQAMLEAPVEDVWALLEDPRHFPEWASGTLEVTGVPTKIEKGSSFEMTSRGPLGLKGTTTFSVEEFEDLREIKLRCQTSGVYSHWLLTEARGGTFADVEFGVDPTPGLTAKVTGALHTKRHLRRVADQSLDGLRGALKHDG